MPMAVSFNLLLIEDADSEQRVAAYNLLNILTIAVGIVIPLGGLLVKAYGIVTGERIILIFAVISMALMMVLRNRVLAATCVALFAIGFGMYKPFMDSMLAEETEGRERAGIYSLFQTLACTSIAITGAISGYIYAVNLRLIYALSLIMLACCFTILILRSRVKNRNQ